jgi:hypothetical protein
MRLFILILLLLGIGQQLTFAQKKGTKSVQLSAADIEKLKLHEDTLSLLGYAAVNDSLEQVRFGACRQLIQGLVRALKIADSYKYPFSRLKTLSILAPPDSSFRIFTWQLFVNDSTYRYFGAIQMNQRELLLHRLLDRSEDMGRAPTHETLTPDRWFGALYYNMIPFDTKSGRQYLLFGYDGYEFYNKRKIVDVLRFDSEGKPLFGSAVFIRDKPLPAGPEQRLVLEYSAEATVKCNWDEQYQMILFDHLITMPSPFGMGFTAVPDGSYDGLKLEKGNWKFVEKVFNDVMEEAPRPEPVLGVPMPKGSEKDVNGNAKKKKKNNADRP